MNVRDAEVNYLSHSKAAALAELMGDVLGSAKAGKQLMDRLLPPLEKATAQNIKDRLRLALSTGAELGLTVKQAQRLQAAWKLVKELHFVELQVGKTLDDPSVAAEAFQAMGWHPVEQFAVLSLDCKHRILACEVISSGTATETLAYPRDIFSSVMRAGGLRYIVAHNHPSGDLEPSPEDLTLTRQLLAASKVMAIPLLDHLIVSRGSLSPSGRQLSYGQRIRDILTSTSPLITPEKTQGLFFAIHTDYTPDSHQGHTSPIILASVALERLY